MTVLVTGAAGFIGSHVALALLDRGEQVIGIDNLNDYYDPALKQARLDRVAAAHGNGFTFGKVDFGDQDALSEFVAAHRFDRIVHLGAQAGVRYSLVDPQAYVRSNLMGQINMLELARHRAVDHFVYASSSSVYGGNDSLPFRVEDRVDQPISLYAATKKADELMSESYAHLFRLPMTGLRFFTVYGPWGRPDMAMWLFAKALMEGRPLTIFNNGEMRRDFTYIDDIVSGIVACLDAPPRDDGETKAGGSRSPHALYNIGNHRSEELMRMVGLIEQAMGRKAQIDFQPMQAGDVKDTFADISAIERDHSFRPRTTIDEGIPRFVQWFKHYHQVA
ncbi:NAD-dependent epimerase/dehydratase family protein [Sphingomonas xanthus]|uniref:NAD-dependent epimerase/dehydratase family protein n=1 Tax=Sphingomonas xanthus TaxID=2594473 RepID=A0A516IPA9_9SPHN|nr:NAD-dependent epimerase/dehydratase family protein [Sphingomonas xanthus]QDP18717.1 NAD-dependent epimerase/dehydratase family protein [Sphingomonas xanthus]